MMPRLCAPVWLAACFFLLSCGNPGDWAEHALGPEEAEARLHEAETLRHRAKLAILRPKPGQPRISQKEAPYAKRPMLVFLVSPRSKYDDRAKLEYHSVNRRLPAHMVPLPGQEAATFVLARSHREAGKQTKSTMHGREVLDLYDYHDVTTLKLVDRETGRYTKTFVRSSKDASIAAALSALPDAPPHPERVTDYFELRREGRRPGHGRLSRGGGPAGREEPGS